MTRGFAAGGLERFDEVAAGHVGNDKVPGLVALVARGDDVHVYTGGSQSIGGPPVRRDTQFRIASTTKPVVGALAMALADDGLFALGDPVERWLPELASPRVLRRMEGPLDDTVPAHRAITVRDLLTFTFGFGMAAEMFMASAPWPVARAVAARGLPTFGPPDPGAPLGPDEWMAGLGSLPLLAQPGDRWLYNTGASALGVLVARAAGATLPELLHRRLLGPLAMRDTAFWTADARRLATAYTATPEGLQVWDEPDGKWHRPPAFPDGAAGLVSTADDLLAFGRMFLEGGSTVLSAGAVAQMTTDQLSVDQRRGAEPFLDRRSWGLCQAVAIEGEATGAFGWDGGLGTSWLVDPVRDLVVVVLTQRLFETAQPPAVHVELQQAAREAAA
jgi:CubicO group peptidase (beta-lactamase class C family)